MREVRTLGKAGQLVSDAMDSGMEEVRVRGRRARKQAAKEAAKQAAAARKQASRRGAAMRKEAAKQLERARKEADKRSRKARKKAVKRAQRLADQLAEQLAEQGSTAAQAARHLRGQIAESMADNVVRTRRELADRLEPAPRRRRWPWLLGLLIVGGAAAAAVLSRRPQEFDSGADVQPVGRAAEGMGPVAPGPVTPSAARGDGAVDAERRARP